METFIQSYCTIQHSTVVVDGKPVFKTDGTDFAGFSKKAYQHFDINYPKFYKMDNLSKLAFLGAELLLKNEVGTDRENNIGLVFSYRL